MYEVTSEDMENLAIGAAVMGTGGGGDPHIGKLMTQRAMAEHGPVEVVSPEELPDDALVIPTMNMGAPTVGIEKVQEGLEPVRALRRLADEQDRELYATMPSECGGSNSTIPFTVGAIEGLPVVDGDGMGRAFPELQQVTFNACGVDGTPAVVANEKGETVLFETEDNVSLERYARAVTVEMGGRVGLANYPMTGAQVQEAAIPGTVSICLRIGEAIRDTPPDVTPLEEVKRVTADTIYGRAIDLFHGKIVDVERRTEGGFAVGSAEIHGLDDHEGEVLHVDFQNENLVARTEKEILVTVPDLITVLEADTGEPITTERLRYGYRVTVLAIPTPTKMRQDAALDIWGPEYFGYDGPYVPLEQRHPEYYREHGLSEGKGHLLE